MERSSPKKGWCKIILLKIWKNYLVKKKNLVKKFGQEYCCPKKIGEKRLVQKSFWSQTILPEKIFVEFYKDFGSLHPGA